MCVYVILMVIPVKKKWRRERERERGTKQKEIRSPPTLNVYSVNDADHRETEDKSNELTNLIRNH